MTKEQRSYCMSKIKSRKTKPELKYQSENIHLEYQPKIFGNPDFIDWKKRAVIFIDGCFWHKCPFHSKIPKSNRGYWLPKLRKNVLRDREVTLAYQKSGWKVIRIWEHDLKKSFEHL